MDHIEYELTQFESREIWHCSVCGRYRHRCRVVGQLDALCCEQRAKLIDRYEQPVDATVRHSVPDAAR